eukprot:2074593-Amphidinium_carterae.1
MPRRTEPNQEANTSQIITTIHKERNNPACVFGSHHTLRSPSSDYPIACTKDGVHTLHMRGFLHMAPCKDDFTFQNLECHGIYLRKLHCVVREAYMCAWYSPLYPNLPVMALPSH